jgi:hypothetical protein
VQFPSWFPADFHALTFTDLRDFTDFTDLKDFTDFTDFHGQTSRTDYCVEIAVQFPSWFPGDFHGLERLHRQTFMDGLHRLHRLERLHGLHKLSRTDYCVEIAVQFPYWFPGDFHGLTSQTFMDGLHRLHRLERLHGLHKLSRTDYFVEIAVQFPSWFPDTDLVPGHYFDCRRRRMGVLFPGDFHGQTTVLRLQCSSRPGSQ